MELIKINDKFFYTYQFNGTNKNGQSIYLINVFKYVGKDYYNNINAMIAMGNKIKLDKHYNIKKVMYKHEIDGYIKKLISELKN